MGDRRGDTGRLGNETRGGVADQTVHEADAAGNVAGDEGDDEEDGCDLDGFMHDPNKHRTLDGARILVLEDLALGPQNHGTAPRTVPVQTDVVVQALVSTIRSIVHLPD
ncbi:hypothetical protein PLEOSDRAFT_1102637 [Pleurotus ostreatus PC15]|uniref:Uncharacterized protein n=1 Tax=Pleurotus ostreatus (strain PC15) TaxID=1137138 RepID=A0A067NKX6_PLEO1|nr:hypothetical protein PLEOSDRAFT_1102637 [Pleurotus ostreatus PC15]